MNQKIAKRFDRARLYLERIRESMRVRDPVKGMADSAELLFQARMLYQEFEAIIKAENETKP